MDQLTRSALRKSLQTSYVNGILKILKSIPKRGKLSTRYETSWKWMLTICCMLKHHSGTIPMDDIHKLAIDMSIHPRTNSTKVSHQRLFSKPTLKNAPKDALLAGLKEVNNEALRANLPAAIKKKVTKPWDFIFPEDIGSCYEIVKELVATESSGTMILEQIGDRRKNGIHHTPFDVTEHMSNLALQKIEISDNNIPDDLIVADISVGAGAFLLQIARIVSNISQKSISYVLKKHIIGFDIDPVALQVCALCFFVEQKCTTENMEFNLFNVDTIGKMNSKEQIREKVRYVAPKSKGCPTITIGNPPYVRIKKAKSEKYSFSSKDSRNLSAYFLEQAINVTEIGKVVCQIVPLSITQSPAMSSIQQVLTSRCSEVIVDAFDCVPGYLFDQGKIGSNSNKAITQRVVIITAVTGSGMDSIQTSRLLRWNSSERDNLFNNIQRQAVMLPVEPFRLPLIGDQTSMEVFKVISSSSRVLSDVITEKGRMKIFIPKAIRYYTSASRVDMKRNQATLLFNDKHNRNLIQILINSSYFYWYWRIFSSGFQISDKNLKNLPIPEKHLQEKYQNEIDSMAESLHRRRKSFLVVKMNKGPVYNLKYENDSLLMNKLDCLIKKLFIVDELFPFHVAKTKSLSEYNRIIDGISLI